MSSQFHEPPREPQFTAAEVRALVAPIVKKYTDIQTWAAVMADITDVLGIKTSPHARLAIPKEEL